MISSFKNYVSDQSSVGYLIFDDFNPPTVGHKELMDEAFKSGYDYKIFASQITESENNPLNYNSKVKFMRKVFPRHARNIILDKSVSNFLEAASYMFDNGYKNLTIVSNDPEKSKLLEQFNGIEGGHGYFKFYKIKQINKEISIDESVQLENAKSGDFAQFSLNLPKTTSDQLAKELFNAVRKGMDLEENKKFTRHVELEPVSERREEYITGNLFHVGQSVLIKESDDVVEITHLGSNYVIVEFEGKKKRKWLTDVEPLEERKSPEDPDIGHRKGSQPKKYHSGLSKSTKAARDSQFKRQAKMRDDDPAAYKLAPGDKSAKTKPSKHTKRFKQMFGEAKSPEQQAAIAISKKKNESSGLWANIHKKRKSGRPMRKKGEKGAPTDDQIRKARGESLDEAAGLAAKAEKSGVSLSILKQVYNRGMAAWKTGHRPGTTPQQWAMARVNSFLTGGKTRRTADKDLWAKAKK